MGELPHVRDANPSEADDEDGWAESSTNEAAVLTSEPDRTRKHSFYVI
jgi:predicted nuclease of predicted toxin-antitoxin system